jgi:DNA helicase-2/ATP-dependent DNA helicase PcrA
VRLEQNYRSTQTILRAANAVIAHNAGRLGKELWSAGEDGEPIQLYAGFNEQDEARFIVEQIEHWIDGGEPRRSVAILYRSNAQSRVLEEALLRQRPALPRLRWSALLRAPGNPQCHGLPAPARQPRR